MDHLKAEGLVIVRGDELANHKEASLKVLQKKYMKKKSLTFKEILDAELLPVKSKQGIESWINRGHIKPAEVGEAKNGVRFILTSAIRRLGYED